MTLDDLRPLAEIAGVSIASLVASRRRVGTVVREALPEFTRELEVRMRALVRQEVTEIVYALVRGELVAPLERIARLEGQMTGVFNVLGMRKREAEKPEPPK